MQVASHRAGRCTLDVASPGTVLGKYPIRRVISTGGMGVIYEAEHPVLGTRVVIKTLRPELSQSDAIAERFRNEALAATRIRDDRLPRIFDVDRLPDHTPFMVMEYLEGEDLGRRLSRGAFTPAYAARVMFEVLEVLHKVHALGIIHRDIKPGNIFIAESELMGEIPKLLDFGVAHFVDDPATAPGEVLGTPQYMAIEQAREGSALGPWTDVFSSGVVLYELLCGFGVRPWRAANTLAYLSTLTKGTPAAPLGDAAPDAPLGLCEAVMRAISVEPADRFSSAAEFAAAIEPYAAPRTTLYEPRRAPPTSTTLAEQETVAAPRSASRGSAPSGSGRSGRLAGLKARLAGLGRGGQRADARDRLTPGERRHVTLLYVTLELRAQGVDALTPEETDALLEEVFGLFRELVDSHGGFVEQAMGDAILATFGRERTGEDDAERALRAALAMMAQRVGVEAALADFGYALRARVGLHSGFVNRSPDRAEGVTGDTVVAARALNAQAPIGGVVASRATLDLVGGRFLHRAAGAIRTPGRGAEIAAFEVTAEAQDAHRWSRSTVTSGHRFVGRVEELEALAGLYRDAVEDPQLRPIALVTGAPGIGKSRLLHELGRFITEAEGLRTWVVHAQPTGDGPYGLWVGVLRRVLYGRGAEAQSTDSLHARVDVLATGLPRPRRGDLMAQLPVLSFLLGLGGEDLLESSRPGEAQSRVERTLQLVLSAAAGRAAREHAGRPMLVALDNLHRADATSLELLNRLLRAPMPGEHPRPMWALGAREPGVIEVPPGAVTSSVPVGRLSGAEVNALAREVAGAEGLSEAAATLVLARSGGNPLYVEEMVLALREQVGTDASVESLRGFDLPASLFGLILSRVDRLGPAQRRALQYASVLGVEFPTSVLEAISTSIRDTDGAPGPVRPRLVELARRGILGRRPTDGEERFFFRQPLTREAVYGTVLSENKRLLHRAAAEAIEAIYPERIDRHLAALLQHYSQTDDVPRILAYARRAGRRAVGLGANAEATEALSMAVALEARVQEPDPVPRASTRFDLAVTAFSAGRLDDAVEQSRTILDILRDAEAEPAVRLRAQASGLLGDTLFQQADPDGARAAMERAAALHDAAGLPYEAASVRCSIGFMLRSLGAVNEGLRIALEGWTILREADDPALVCRAGHDLGNILRDVGRHSAALDVLARAMEAGERLYESGNTPAAVYGVYAARSARAMTLASLGRLDEAIEEQRAVVERAEAAGHSIASAVGGYHLASHLMERGDLVEAAERIDHALSVCAAAGLPNRALKCRVLAARLAREESRLDDAVEHLEAAEFLARRSRAANARWLDVVEPLVALLREVGREDRVDALRAAARARAERDEDSTFRDRVSSL